MVDGILELDDEGEGNAALNVPLEGQIDNLPETESISRSTPHKDVLTD